MSLRNERMKKGLSLQGLSIKSGVHYMNIHKMETGKMKVENITLRNALKLAKALGCQPEALL
ncbi:MAG: helix-turn-helix transcriptional regulator [Oscillospiraceae bacterium]|nr:helix-turn-helix transcriptional regulator [Oscillospiraceae bacterium]